jgi:hypothetical protein
MGTGRPNAGPFVFVSYVEADRAWAEWLSWLLEAHGVAVRMFGWHAVPGSNRVQWLHETATAAQQTLIVLSQDYLDAADVAAQWQAAFGGASGAARSNLVPVTVRPCQPRGLLADLVAIDVVGLGEDAARDAFIGGMRAAEAGTCAPARSDAPPPYPGAVSAGSTGSTEGAGGDGAAGAAGTGHGSRRREVRPPIFSAAGGADPRQKAKRPCRRSVCSRPLSSSCSSRTRRPSGLLAVILAVLSVLLLRRVAGGFDPVVGLLILAVILLAGSGGWSGTQAVSPWPEHSNIWVWLPRSERESGPMAMDLLLSEMTEASRRPLRMQTSRPNEKIMQKVDNT